MSSCVSTWPLEPDRRSEPEISQLSFSLEERLLDTVSDGVEFGNISFSPDGRHVAYTVYPQGLGQGARKMVVDRQAGPEYDWLTHVQFSPDSRHWDYSAKRGDSYAVVTNGKERQSPGWTYYSLLSGACDGPYIFPVDMRRKVIVNGAESREWDDISIIEMSDDHRRYAYFGRAGEKYYPVIDGMLGEPSDRDPSLPIRGTSDLMDSPMLSKSGNHVGYPVLKADAAFMVMDGRKDGPFTLIWPPVWSEDESRFGYFAQYQGKQRAVIDHQIDDRFEVLGWTPVFSRDGKRVGFVGIDHDKQFPVIDGTRGPSYGEVGQITFSPGGEHVAYVACDSAKPQHERGYLKNAFVVLDGRRQNNYDAIEYLTFSGDGRHFAFSARSGDRHLVIVDSIELMYLIRDDEEGLRASAFGLTFSPDHRHLCWYTYSGNREAAVVLDGKIVDRSVSLCEEPRFDKDSKHIGFGVVKGRELWWKVVEVH